MLAHRVLDRELVQSELAGELVDLGRDGPHRSTHTTMSASPRYCETSVTGKPSASSTPLRYTRVCAAVMALLAIAPIAITWHRSYRSSTDRPGTVHRVNAKANGSRDLPATVLERLRTICLALPGMHEEPAWAGTRWCVGSKNVAHVVRIVDAWPPAYARAVGDDGPRVVLTFRVTDEDHEALRFAGAPFVRPDWGLGWSPPVAGVMLDDATDWDDVAGWITDSHRLLAPKRARRD